MLWDTSALSLEEPGIKLASFLLPVNPRYLLRYRILTDCITAWYGNCTALNRKCFQRVVKTAKHITRTELPFMEDLYTQWCSTKTNDSYVIITIIVL